MKLFRHFSLLLAALLGMATVVSAQEAPAVAPVVEEAPASLESAPSEAPALDSVAPASLPTEDPDPAATPVAPRDLGLPAPTVGEDSAEAIPAEAIPRPEEMAAETIVPEEPSVLPSGSELKKRKPAPPKPAIPASATEAVQLTIRVGKDGPKETFSISLRPDLAPQTVAAFKQNVESGFYEGLAFHRLIRNYCRECFKTGTGGRLLCPHQKRKVHCSECAPSRLCKHNKQVRQCKHCSEAGLCKHQKDKGACSECRRESKCRHKKSRWVSCECVLPQGACQEGGC